MGVDGDAGAREGATESNQACSVQVCSNQVCLVQVCSVRLGNAFYGIPIGHILEIVGGAGPQHVPLAPEFVGGLMHYRGDVLTTVSLRQVLGLPTEERTQEVLVVESAEGVFGLLVDAVMEVIAVSSADFEPNPPTARGERHDLFAGAYKLGNGLMVMLNPQRLEPMRLSEAA